MPNRSGGQARVDVDINEANLHAQVDPRLRKIANEVAHDIRNEARRIAPIRTGRLRRSITAGWLRARPGLLSAKVIAAAPYAAYVHEGTRPHVIRARRAKALHFRWHGREVFFTSVHHPGNRANPFLAIAAARVAARHR